MDTDKIYMPERNYDKNSIYMFENVCLQQCLDHTKRCGTMSGKWVF